MFEARKHCPWAMWFVRVLSPMKRAGATELIITKAVAEMDGMSRAVVLAGVRLILRGAGRRYGCRPHAAAAKPIMLATPSRPFWYGHSIY